jgi:hypothetical protein
MTRRWKKEPEPEVPATWREHFGLDPELDTIQPGHTRGYRWMLIVMALGCAVLIYGIARGF